MADLVNAVLEFLKLNGTISDLEKDIWTLRTSCLNNLSPAKMFKKKVGENYQNHYDIIVSAGLVLGGNFMPFQARSVTFTPFAFLITFEVLLPFTSLYRQ